ncbi:MAG TPA: hypothetical protein DCE42_04985, partial [Myxococcales bacterium]|nr:hypothetical protein [Myxococcales bacterium]
KPPPPSPKSSSFAVHSAQDDRGFSADDMLSDELSDPDATMMVPDAIKPQSPYSSTPDYSLELPLSETGELDPSELTTIGNSETLPPHLMEMEDDPDALDAFIEDELDWEPTQIFGPDSDFVSPNYAPASSEVQVNTPPQKKTKHPTQAYAPPRASFPKTSSEASSFHQSEHSDSGVSVSSPSAAPRSDAGYEDPLLHSVINEYRLVERLGVGSFASVYRVEHTRIDKSFAMKILHPHVASQEKLVKRFYREVRSLSTLHHPNIVQINDFDHVPQYGFYLIMEWIRGVSLTRYVRQRTRLSPKETLHLYGQLLSALSYAHDLGISHRDLKPGNIMIIEETNAFTGEVNAKLKILDFSLANFEDEEESLTMTGAIIGSPKYMSPEQAKGITTEVDYRSDLYSCGIILGKCLTGRDIFSGESPTQILMQHITSPPPALNSLFPDGQFPQELEQVYQHSLSKDKEERYQSASEFFQDLKSALALCL